MSRQPIYAILRKIPANRLHIPEENYQRYAIAAHVNKIVNSWEDELARPAMVVKIGNTNKYEVFDGGHTVRCYRILYGPNVKIPCQIVRTKHPARKFITLNTNVRALNKVDMFKALLDDKEPSTVGVKTAVEATGHLLRMGNIRGATKIEQFGTHASWPLLEFYRTHGERTFRSMLALLTTHFARPDGEYIEKDAKAALFINALNALYTEAYSPEEIFYALGNWKLSAADIQQRAREVGGNGTGITRQIYKLMRQRLNRRVKK